MNHIFCKHLKLVLTFYLFIFSSINYAATLQSMTHVELEKAFTNKTIVSIPIDNLNGKTVNNSNSAYFDGHGHIIGKMSIKPDNLPQMDEGIYTFQLNGKVNVKWKQWDDAQQLCFYMYATKNAYIAIDCNNVFHSVFMKDSIKQGNKLSN